MISIFLNQILIMNYESTSDNDSINIASKILLFQPDNEADTGLLSFFRMEKILYFSRSMQKLFVKIFLSMKSMIS